MDITYTISLVFHVLGVIVAVGSATIVDYLHLIGIRKKKLEKGLVNIYPHITTMINISLGIIYLSGTFLVVQNPALLSSPLFITKMVLVIIVTINGLYLQRSVSPELDKCVLKGANYCTTSVLTRSALCGSISIVTWYSIVILSLTKNLQYTASQFTLTYFIVLILVIIIAYSIELRSRKWR